MFFLTFFFLGSSNSLTSSDTCSGAAHFWAGFLDGAGLASVLVGVLVDVLDLRTGLFLLMGLSTLSSGKGSTMEGAKLRV